jgi:hypothetical protein
MAIQSEMTSAMLKNGVIEYADSEWSTGVVMAKKKGTSDKRYAVDYRGLNEHLLGNVIGVPRIDDLLDAWSKAQWWSTFDLAAAFWSIPMRESDKKFTAFHAYCDGGFQQYQFRVMPFGLKPASSLFQASFQRVMQNLYHSVRSTLTTESVPLKLTHLNSTCNTWHTASHDLKPIT